MSSKRRTPSRGIIAALVLGACAGLAVSSGSVARAQVINPVYVDDSPAASDTFLRVRDHLASGNLPEAVRVIQVLLEEMPDRMVLNGAAQGRVSKQLEGPPAARPAVVDPAAVNPGVPGEPPAVVSGPTIGTDARDLFRSVRVEAHEVLLSVPELLEAYRAAQEPIAQAKLAAGELEEVERSYLLTSTGFEAALRMAQRRFENAQFYAAALTLRQLDAHPDRKGPAGAAATALAEQLTRYLDDPTARELVQRWGGKATGAAVQWPAAARIDGLSPLEGPGSADLAEVVGKPLRWMPIADDTLVRDVLDSLRATESERLPPTARHLTVMPTVADDTLYLNNGVQISAWDRITLAPKWTVRADVPAGEDPVQSAQNLRAAMRGTSSPEDVTMVTVSGRTAVATLGLALGSTRWPDGRVVAIDTLTGRVKWGISIEDLDPALASQGVRGPALISEGAVVLSLRASLPERRMVTLYQAGLDLTTGALQWFHLVGSTGALPYRNDPYVSDAAALHQGIVYHADMLGVVSATEAVTGRPVWVRRMPSASVQTWDSLNPWQIGEPLIDGDSLIVLSPDHRQVVRLDRRTGELKGWCSTQRFETQPARYIIRVGANLGVVFDNRIAIVPLETFDTAPVKLTPKIAEPGINGRVTVAGEKIVIPIVSGLQIVDASRADAEPVLMPLDNPGNVLAIESQLVVVDDEVVHSYLLWEVAERLLSARMQEDPSDPTAATTLAELAYRAGRQDRIVAAVDAALKALETKPDAENAEPTRARLFGSLHVMAAESLEPTVRPVVGADAGEAHAELIKDDALLGAVVERMERAARTPDERLAHLLSLGRLYESRKAHAGAIDTYQKILDDERLAGATWAGPRLSTRGELEVTRRMESLVREQGAAVYAAHDAKATAAAAQLGADAPVELLTRLASRYPVSVAAAGLWERAAETYKRAGRDHSVVGALELALDAAERIPGAPRIGEVAGRLVSELEARQQYAAAGNALKNVLERYPETRIIIAGEQVDAKALGERLATQVAARQRWPHVGELRGEGMQVISGWSLMDPMMRVRTGVAPRGVVLKSSDQIALFMPTDPQPGNQTGAGELAPVWRRTIETDVFELVRIDSEAAYFFYASGKGAMVEKVTQSPGEMKWATVLFSDLPARPAAPRTPGRREVEQGFPTPQDGIALLTDGVMAMDDRTMVFMERQGHATALDTQSGAVLWTVESPLDRVYDATVLGGTLVVAGDQEVASGPGERATSLRPEIAVVDARTGQEVQRLPQRWGTIRWVRLTESGQLIAGCENAIVSTDLARGQVNWVLSDPHLTTSRDAWVFQDAVFILDRERRLWWADATSGQVSAEALETPRDRLGGVRRIDASLLNSAGADAQPLVAFSTYQGVLLYDLNGNLKGMDAVGGLDGLLPPIPAHDRIVTITTMPEARRNDRDMLFNVHALDTKSAMVVETVPIVLGVPPRNIALLDGRVIITAGGTTLVVPAPPTKEK